MGIGEVLEGKRQWRAHMARVKALPADYRIVYELHDHVLLVLVVAVGHRSDIYERR